MNRQKLLLIDDEASLCRLIKLNLERTGEFEVTVAHSGEEGLRKAGETAFDLVITDLKMPGMDGYQVVEELKATNPHVPVIILSASSSDTMSKKKPEIANLIACFIVKPINHEELLKKIHEVLGQGK